MKAKPLALSLIDAQHWTLSLTVILTDVIKNEGKMEVCSALNYRQPPVFSFQTLRRRIALLASLISTFLATLTTREITVMHISTDCSLKMEISHVVDTEDDSAVSEDEENKNVGILVKESATE